MIPWWIYILIGFGIGVCAGGILTRRFYFPKYAGKLLIAKDLDTSNGYYVFLQAIEDPEVLRNYHDIRLEIVDKTN